MLYQNIPRRIITKNLRRTFINQDHTDDALFRHADSFNRKVCLYLSPQPFFIKHQNCVSALIRYGSGSLIHIDTHYGSYVYRVTEMKLADYQDTTTYDFTRTDENLILYTCYPFDAFGFTPERYFVYAEYVSGPMIDKSK